MWIVFSQSSASAGQREIGKSVGRKPNLWPPCAKRWSSANTFALAWWYQALAESPIPFDIVHDRLLAPQLLGGYSTLILPNIAALSETQCDQLRTFVRKGGT